MSSRRTPHEERRPGADPQPTPYPRWVQAVALLLVAALVFWAVASIF